MTKEEKLIEDKIDELKPISGKKKGGIDQILKRARKNKSISLRISSYDLDKLKEKAERVGIPYQTLINSVLHKYVSNQLFDEDEIIKSISAQVNIVRD